MGLLAISPDERLMVTSDYCALTFDCDRIVHIRELATGRVVRTLRGHENQIPNGAFSPSGKVLATSDQEGGVRLWYVDTGDLVTKLRGHRDSAQIEFSRSGELIVTWSRHGKILVYHCEACGSMKALLRRAHMRSVRNLSCQERRAYLNEELDCL